MHPDTSTPEILHLEREKFDFEREKFAFESKKLAFEEEKAKLEREKHARERWWHEDRLVNERLTWLFTMQGLMWGGYAFLRYRMTEIAFAMADKKPSDVDSYIDALANVAWWVQLIGTVSALIIFASVLAAVFAQHELQEQYKPIQLGVTNETTRAGHGAALAAPFLCVVAWGITFSLLPPRPPVLTASSPPATQSVPAPSPRANAINP